MENIIINSDNYKIRYNKVRKTNKITTLKCEAFEYEILDRNGENAVLEKFDSAAKAIRYAEDKYSSLV